QAVPESSSITRGSEIQRRRQCCDSGRRSAILLRCSLLVVWDDYTRSRYLLYQALPAMWWVRQAVTRGPISRETQLWLLLLPKASRSSMRGRKLVAMASLERLVVEYFLSPRTDPASKMQFPLHTVACRAPNSMACSAGGISLQGAGHTRRSLARH
ncbi:hypothetical protein TCAP_07200, partial [Tolypocladium capitatum]